eukprot:ANDGO_03501.mRNA.1 hypothetical protein
MSELLRLMTSVLGLSSLHPNEKTRTLLSLGAGVLSASAAWIMLASSVYESYRVETELADLTEEEERKKTQRRLLFQRSLVWTSAVGGSLAAGYVVGRIQGRKVYLKALQQVEDILAASKPK